MDVFPETMRLSRVRGISAANCSLCVAPSAPSEQVAPPMELREGGGPSRSSSPACVIKPPPAQLLAHPHSAGVVEAFRVCTARDGGCLFTAVAIGLQQCKPLASPEAWSTPSTGDDVRHLLAAHAIKLTLGGGTLVGIALSQWLEWRTSTFAATTVGLLGHLGAYVDALEGGSLLGGPFELQLASDLFRVNVHVFSETAHGFRLERAVRVIPVVKGPFGKDVLQAFHRVDMTISLVFDDSDEAHYDALVGLGVVAMMKLFPGEHTDWSGYECERFRNMYSIFHCTEGSYNSLSNSLCIATKKRFDVDVALSSVKSFCDGLMSNPASSSPGSGAMVRYSEGLSIAEGKVKRPRSRYESFDNSEVVDVDGLSLPSLRPWCGMRVEVLFFPSLEVHRSRVQVMSGRDMAPVWQSGTVVNIANDVQLPHKVTFDATILEPDGMSIQFDLEREYACGALRVHTGAFQSTAPLALQSASCSQDRGYNSPWAQKVLSTFIAMATPGRPLATPADESQYVPFGNLGSLFDGMPSVCLLDGLLVEVHQSSGRGRGVFTCGETIYPGTLLGMYYGVIFNKAQWSRLVAAMPPGDARSSAVAARVYSYTVGTVDGASFVFAPPGDVIDASFCNSPSDDKGEVENAILLERHTEIRVGAQYDEDGVISMAPVCLVAKKKIPPHSEVLLGYGDQFMSLHRGWKERQVAPMSAGAIVQYSASMPSCLLFLQSRCHLRPELAAQVILASAPESEEMRRSRSRFCRNLRHIRQEHADGILADLLEAHRNEMTAHFSEVISAFRGTTSEKSPSPPSTASTPSHSTALKLIVGHTGRHSGAWNAATAPAPPPPELVDVQNGPCHTLQPLPVQASPAIVQLREMTKEWVASMCGETAQDQVLLNLVEHFERPAPPRQTAFMYGLVDDGGDSKHSTETDSVDYASSEETYDQPPHIAETGEAFDSETKKEKEAEEHTVDRASPYNHERFFYMLAADAPLGVEVEKLVEVNS